MTDMELKLRLKDKLIFVIEIAIAKNIYSNASSDLRAVKDNNLSIVDILTLLTAYNTMLEAIG